LELERVYSQFKELYEDIERQRRFSDLLVEAIGDAIMLRRLWLLIADIKDSSGDRSGAQKARQKALSY